VTLPQQPEFLLSEPIAPPAVDPGFQPDFRVYVFGRLHGITRKRLNWLVRMARGELLTAGSRASLVVLAHGTAASVIESAALPRSFPKGAAVESEGLFRRRLSLSRGVSELHRTLDAGEIMRGARIDEDALRWLVLYDVLEPFEDRYSYPDLLAAREVSRLLSEGFRLQEIVPAAVKLAGAGYRLSDTRLAQSPWGEILQQFRGQLGRLDGQFALPLPTEELVTLEDAFGRAEACEAEEDWAGAERWYSIAKKLDRVDPVIPFNLANVLDEQGRHLEALLTYHEALARDPLFPEAWYNLALLAEGRSAVTEAIQYLREAIAVWPKYGDALFALGRLLVDQGDFKAAELVWTRLLASDPAPRIASLASRYAALCRLELIERGRADALATKAPKGILA
jgi:tetratricopeptide (TPR) repeat protein